MAELEFDLNRLTVAQVEAQFEAEINMDFDKMAEGLALAVVKIEGRTDPITAATFAGLKYWQWKRAMTAFRAALQSHPVPDNEIAGLVYDVQNLAARDMVNLQKALRRLDTRTMIDVLTRTVTGCPAEWGKPDKPATWRKRSFYGEVMATVQAIIRDANDTEKNGSATSIFG